MTSFIRLCLLSLGLLFIDQLRAADTYRVAIIDRFYPPVSGFESAEERDQHTWLYGVFDLDDDELKEPYYHGDVVQMIAADPRFIFLQYPLAGRQHPMQEILLNLQELQARHELQPVDALVLSWESSTLISEFDVPLSLHRVRQYKNIIRSWGQEHEVWEHTHGIILALEKLAASGVEVFTISGNGGRGMVNTFSFAEGVKTVGAIEPGLQHFIADNPFVDMRTRAAYQLSRLDTPGGKVEGYDIDGDGCLDVPLERFSGYVRSAAEGTAVYPQHHWKTLKGSSYAAPAAMKGILLEAAGDSC